MAAQPLPDSLLQAAAVNQAIASYQHTIGENLHLYNGAEYLQVGHGVKGSPFFASDSMLPASIVYDGRLYQAVPVWYDLVTDNLIIKNFTGNNVLQLVPEKVDSFTIGHHHFIRIAADSTMPAAMHTGFYEKLHGGMLPVFARREKLAVLTGRPADNEFSYKTYNYYYILLNTVFYPVNDKKQLLSLLADKANEVNQYIKTAKLNFKKRPEESLVMVAQYYSQLKN